MCSERPANDRCFLWMSHTGDRCSSRAVTSPPLARPSWLWADQWAAECVWVLVYGSCNRGWFQWRGDRASDLRRAWHPAAWWMSWTQRSHQWRQFQLTCRFSSVARGFRAKLLPFYADWVACRSLGTSAKHRWHIVMQLPTASCRPGGPPCKAVCRRRTGGDGGDVQKRHCRQEKMYKENSSGPRTLPCGTPDKHATGVEWDEPTPTYWVLPIKNESSHSRATPSILKWQRHSPIRHWQPQC